MCKSFENCNLTNQPAVQLPYWVCQFPVPAELKSTIVRDQGLFFAMPLSHFFNKEGSRYSEKYCMCALCVHWVCDNIQGALSPESLLRPSISLLLNLRQKKKEYHINANTTAPYCYHKRDFWSIIFKNCWILFKRAQMIVKYVDWDRAITCS